jgi:hypothetical protein
MLLENYLSVNWKIKANESVEIFNLRIHIQTQEWQNTVRQHGNIYLIKFGENDIRVLQEDQIDIEELVKQIVQPIYVALDCPLCQPYDHFDVQTMQYVERRYLTKIVYPKYPEGFIDKEGVWCKCCCTLKGERRKWLKFRKTRNV